MKDTALSDLITALSPLERAALQKHLQGRPTLESRELLRMLRRKLKRKIRRRVKKFTWLA